MIDNSNHEISLPEEFKSKPLRLSFLRIMAMASVMGFAVFLVKTGVDKNIMKEASTSEADQSPVEPFSAATMPAPREPPLTSLTQDKTSLNEPQVAKNFYAPGSLRTYVYHELSKRAFVAGDVINIRVKPGGPLLGQLPKGDALEILDEPDQTGFIKVQTSYGQVGYVSKDLISADRAIGVFDPGRLEHVQADDVVVSVSSGQNPDERSRHYSFFLELLERLPTKASFDFASSSLRYMIVDSSEVLYPTDPGAVLRVLRQASFKPAVFFERRKSTGQVAEDAMVIKTKLPVRRVTANEGAQSTKLIQVQVSTKCYPMRMTVKTELPSSSKLELIAVDIKKSMTVTLTTRPHKGDPNFTWAFADLNGDTWPDLATYFGGQTSASPYKFLFVAHNINGRWQIHRIEDRSGFIHSCT